MYVRFRLVLGTSADHHPQDPKLLGKPLPLPRKGARFASTAAAVDHSMLRATYCYLLLCKLMFLFSLTFRAGREHLGFILVLCGLYIRKVGDVNYAVEFIMCGLWGCQHVTYQVYSSTGCACRVRKARDSPGLRARTMADVSRPPRRLGMLYMVCLQACLPSPSGSFLHSSSSIGGGAISSPRLVGPPPACRTPTPRRTAVGGPMRAKLEGSQPVAIQEERTGTRRLEDLKVGAHFHGTSIIYY